MSQDSSAVGDSIKAPFPPRIYPLGLCDAKTNKCIEDHSNANGGISVNGRSTGDVIITDGAGNAKVRFYAYADDDQMPLRKVAVDWNDGTPISGDGLYRNHRGQAQSTCDTTAKTCVYGGKPIANTSCQKDADCPRKDNCTPDAKSFGHVEGQTCDNEYFEFNHVYQCDRRNPADNFSPTCTGHEAEFPGGCCIFQPKAQVKDNWGWCNGKCSNHTAANGTVVNGCYKGVLDECFYNQGAWTGFSGKVIVAPK